MAPLIVGLWRRQARAALTRPSHCSFFVLMETLADALREGWRIELRCQRPSRVGTAKLGRCQYSVTLDLETLVATRGGPFPVNLLQSRLKCPKCGSRNIVVVFLGDRPRAAAALAR